MPKIARSKSGMADGLTCSSCNDLGLFRVGYHDGSPTHYLLCLCRVGESLRRATNHGKPVTPLWQVWASRHGIPVEQIAPMEDVLTDAELAERGFTELTSPADALSAIAAAAKARSKR